MSRIYTRRTMAGIFILVSAIYFVFAVANKPRVLVLHSYATDYVWVREVSEGLRSVLDDSPYDVRWHYMDTKRHPDPLYYERAGKSARRVIEEWEPRVIIAIDDHAQQYVASCYTRSESGGTEQPGGPRSQCPEDELSDLELDIVYTGVNATPEDYGYEKATNVTGLLQRLPLDLVKAALLETFKFECDPESTSTDGSAEPDPHACRREVLYLRDSSTTSHWREREIMSFDWGPEYRLTSRAVETLAEWQQEMLDAPKRFDLIFFSDYRKLELAGKRGIVNGDAVVEWNHSCGELPMVGLGSSYGEIGEALSFSVAPFEQGAVAADMALDIIRNRTAETQRSSEGMVVYLRGDLERGYTVPGLFQAFAHATGTHFEREEPEPCEGAHELAPVFVD